MIKIHYAFAFALAALCAQPAPLRAADGLKVGSYRLLPAESKLWYILGIHNSITDDLSEKDMIPGYENKDECKPQYATNKVIEFSFEGWLTRNADMASQSVARAYKKYFISRCLNHVD